MIRSFKFSSFRRRNFLADAVIFGALSLAGCGDNCFSGFFNGGFQVNTASPPSACALSKATAPVRTAIVQSPSCASCTCSARVEHLYVTLRGVQLSSGDQSSPDWVEIAPQLVNEPRQMDLIGNSETELVEGRAMIPAGTYRQARLEFLSDTSNAGHFLGRTECGTTLQNCIVTGDGRVDPVLWPGDLPELLITGLSVQGGALVVLPDTMVDIRINVEPQQVFSSSSSEPWMARELLVGRADVIRLQPKSKNPD